MTRWLHGALWVLGVLAVYEYGVMFAGWLWLQVTL